MSDLSNESPFVEEMDAAVSVPAHSDEPVVVSNLVSDLNDLRREVEKLRAETLMRGNSVSERTFRGAQISFDHKVSPSKNFLKKPFAFFPDTGKNIGVCIIIQCWLVDF